MARKRRSKRRIHERIHFRRRTYERYGIVMTKEKEQQLLSLIKDPKSVRPGGEVVVVRRLSATRAVYFVWSQEDKRWLKVAYDRKRSQLVTALPLDPRACLETEQEDDQFLPSHTPPFR